MDVVKVDKQVKALLEAQNLNVTDETLVEFLLDDRYGHPALFDPEHLEDGDLWFGAGCLDDDIEVFSVSNDKDLLLALAYVCAEKTRVWYLRQAWWVDG